MIGRRIRGWPCQGPMKEDAMKKIIMIGFVFLLASAYACQEKQVLKSNHESPLITLHKKIETGKYGYVDSMLLVRNGFVVFEKYYKHDYVKINKDKDPSDWIYNYYNPNYHPFYKGSKLHTLQSVTKSITSALIGIAIGRGEIPGVNVKIMDFFNEDDILNVDQRKKNITLEDVLTMRTGIQWNESIAYTDPRNSCIQMEASNDWVKFVINQPMANEPGTVFEYNSGASQLLSFIIKKSTGMTIDKYAEKFLFGPLGIKNYYWKRTPANLPDTEGGLYLEPRDLAKIGTLYLTDGVWQDKQVLPKGWVQSAVKPHVEDVSPESPRNNSGYGYKWWLLPNKNNPTTYIYAAIGYGGQYMFVVPGSDLIAVFTGWNIYHSTRLPTNVIFDLLDSAKSPIESKDFPKL